MKMRELAVVSSSVSLIEERHDHEMASAQSKWPKNLAAFLNLLTSSLCTCSYCFTNKSRKRGE